MKLCLLIIAMASLSNHLIARIESPDQTITRLPKVVYGDNNRLPIVAESSASNIIKGSDASMAIIHRQYLKEQEDGSFEIVGKTWREKLNMCPDQPFVNEPIVANCSAVLVAPQLALTASHCILGKPRDFCKHYRFTFGYQAENSSIEKNEIYRCAEVLEHHYNRSEGIDWALVSLDREVLDHEPIEIVAAPRLGAKDTMTMIGYPAGLPRKVTDNGTLRESFPHFLRTNFDSFTGNSGSPVFNSTTGDFLGLLIRGEEDYQYDKSQACLRPKFCKEGDCQGEDIVKIESILATAPYLLNKIE